MKRMNSSETAKVYNQKWPTTGGIRGEKSFGQGEMCSYNGDQHTVAGSSLDWTEHSTRSNEAVNSHSAG
jgi:hypothetical protein